MNKSKLIIIVIAVIVVVAVFYQNNSDSTKDVACTIPETIEISEMNWESAGVLANIAHRIINDGYGCNSQLVPGSTVPTATTMLSKNKPHFVPELWAGTLSEILGQIEEKGTYRVIGPTFESAGEGLWVPDYILEENPGLKSFDDLKDYAHLFEEVSTKGKGRIYGCPPGWACEIVTQNLFNALGLADTYELFSPGDQGALDASMARRVQQKKGVIGYYWEPTTLVAKLKLVKLKGPAHDPEKWICLSDPNCENPEVTDWPSAKVLVMASSIFDQDERVKQFVDNFTVPNGPFYESLNWLSENSASYEETAIHFLKNQEDVWGNWVTPEAKEKVIASLAQ